MKYAREKAHDVIPELGPLIKKNWREISSFPDFEVDPNFDGYRAAEDSGILRVFTDRTERGVLVGYSIVYIYPHMHFKNSVQAIQDVLFILPEHRGHGAWFVKWCDACLFHEGAEVIYRTANVRHNCGSLFRRMGYDLIDQVYAKRKK